MAKIRGRMMTKIRCGWSGNDPLYMAYHDTEWGRSLYDSRELFEKLILDGFQAGLSWITILKRRETFITAFHGFEPKIIAQYDDNDIQRLMNDKGIIRNKLKILATIKNAKIYLEMEAEKEGAFSEFLWSFVGAAQIQNTWKNSADVPAETIQSHAMSKALKERGFGFCGPTICYAFMQAVGMVNDHVTDCFCHESCSKK